MKEHEFILQDRIAKIKSIDEQLDLQNNSYLAFSGGKDSVVVSHLLDIALPNNKIPRVFSNTGLEYSDIVKYVKSINDERIVILNQNRDIKKTLEEYGYPFKSKEHAMRVMYFNKGSEGFYLKKYLGEISYGRSSATRKFLCPKKLKYQFKERGKYNFSDQCCHKLKKDLQKVWQKENGKTIVITGMRNEEGGNRTRLSCLSRNNTKFHPIVVCSSEWEDWFIKEQGIQLCRLYYPPFNFERTGCVGCPFNVHLEQELNTLERFIPRERERAERIFAYTYAEYRRINYRLTYQKELNFGGPDERTET